MELSFSAGQFGLAILLLLHWAAREYIPLFSGSLARSAGEPGGSILRDGHWRVPRYIAEPRDRSDYGIVIRDEEHADRQSPTEVVRGLRWVDDAMQGRAPSIVSPSHHQIDCRARPFNSGKAKSSMGIPPRQAAVSGIEVAPFQWTVCQLAVYVLVMAARMSAS
jgi:hypothetical protein